MKHLNPINLIIIAVAVAITGIFFIRAETNHFFLNLQEGKIHLSDACRNASNDDWYCDAELPYRWLLLACAVVVTASIIWHRHRAGRN